MITSQISELINTKSAPTSNSKNELGKQDFLKLLIAQLENQDPLNVQDDKQFIAQLAQFTSLEQTQNLTNSFNSFFEFQQLTQSSNLIDKEVEIQPTLTKGENLTGSDKNIKGKVSEVRMVNGKVKVMVNDNLYDIKDIIKVSSKDSK